MLTECLELSRRPQVSSLIETMKPYSVKLSRKGLPPLSEEIKCFQKDILFQVNKSKIINIYFALSRATLIQMHNEYHLDSRFKYERCITPHEDLIYNELTSGHGLKVVRQLLVGGCHSDIYIPALHFCIEPSSERYFSTSTRSRAEAKMVEDRLQMRGLGVWYTEDFKRTKSNISSFVLNMKSNFINDSLVIQENYYSMACHTLPRFIPYKTFSSLIKSTSITSSI